MTNRFYVYLHRNLSGVFYVGKGTRERANSTTGRTKSWRENSKDGYIIQIIKSGLTEIEALTLEAQLIKIYQPTSNRQVNSSVLPISYQDISTKLAICTKSASGLLWVVKGKSAGCLNKRTGYYVVRIGNTLYQAHRLVYLLANKSIDPTLVVDHIDGNRINNSVGNLRLVRKSVNNFNRSKTADSSIEFRGNSYIVYWRVNGKRKTKSFCVTKSEDAFLAAQNYRDTLHRELYGI